MLKRMLLASFIMLLTSGLYAGDAAAGKAKSTTCAACHGSSGISMIPIYPNLAGQHQSYLSTSLKAYRSQQRKGGNAAMMWGIAASLSDDDIDDLAAYYASLPSTK